MICNKCGKILPADSGFCQYCANKIEQVDVNTVAEDPSHKDIIDGNFSQKKSVQINRKAKKKSIPQSL